MQMKMIFTYVSLINLCSPQIDCRHSVGKSMTEVLKMVKKCSLLKCKVPGTPAPCDLTKKLAWRARIWESFENLPE